MLTARHVREGEVVGWREVPSAYAFHQKAVLAQMVVTVVSDDIECHAAKGLFDIANVSGD